MNLSLNPEFYKTTLDAIASHQIQLNLNPEHYKKTFDAGLQLTVNSASKLREKLDHYHKTHLDENVMRDTPLRYFAYSDQVGQATASLVHPKWVNRSSRLGNLYIILDVISMAHKGYHNSKQATYFKRLKDSFREFGESTLFHMGASYLIPGAIVKSTRILTHKALAAPFVAPWIAKRAPLFSAIISLSTLPFLSKPVDKLADSVLHKVFHPTVKKLQYEMEVIKKMAQEQRQRRFQQRGTQTELQPLPGTSVVNYSFKQPKTFDAMFH